MQICQFINVQDHLKFLPSLFCLTHLGYYKMAANLQAIFSNAFSSVQIVFNFDSDFTELYS